jgi:predicted lipoprotein with Yx(FWY)xxD motif
MARVSSLVFVMALVVSACGGTAATPTPTTAPTASPAATPTATVAATATAAATPSTAPSGSPATSGSPGTSGSPAAEGTTVTIATNALGQILVGAGGLTLYGFTPDQVAGKPTCNGDCAALWPPLTVTGTDFTVGTGLDKSMFKLVARDDGTMQLAVNDLPLYYYTPDDVPGDTKGQDVADKWFVVGTDGALIGAPAS